MRMLASGLTNLTTGRANKADEIALFINNWREASVYGASNDLRRLAMTKRSTGAGSGNQA